MGFFRLKLVIAAVVVGCALVACGDDGGGSRPYKADRSGWIAEESERVGHTLDAEEEAKLEAAHLSTCDLDDDAMRYFVAMARDNSQDDLVDVTVKWFCPHRTSEVAEIRADFD